MAIKVFIKNNYLTVDIPGADDHLSDHKSKVFINPTSVTDEYLISSPKIGDRKVLLTNLVDVNDVAFNLTTWTDFYTLNTGFNLASASGVTIGNTNVINGTNGKFLTVNNGVLGESNVILDVNQKSLLLIGDSITAQGYNSASNRFYNSGWWCWALAFGGWNMNVKEVTAVSGYTTLEVLTDLEVQLQNNLPNWTWGIIGQNDLGVTDSALVVTQLDMIISLCEKYDANLMLGTVTPRTSMNTQIKEDLSVINNALKNFALTGRIVLFDSSIAIIDSTSLTGEANQNYLYDNIHPNPSGAWRIGKVAHDKISKFLTSSNYSDALNSGNDASINADAFVLNKNCTLVGNSGTFAGGGSGDVANNFLMGRSIGNVLTSVGSKVLVNDFAEINKQRIVFSGTIATTEEVRFQQTFAITNFITPIISGTDKVRAGATVNMTDFSNNLRDCKVAIESISSGVSTTIAQSMCENGFDISISPTYNYSMITPNTSIPVNCESLRITVYTKFSAGVCNGQLDLSNVFLELL